MEDEIDDTYIMPFGKHRGVSLGAVPASYLLWCYDQEGMADSRPELYGYIKKNLKHLQAEAGEEEYEREEWNEF